MAVSLLALGCAAGALALLWAGRRRVRRCALPGAVRDAAAAPSSRAELCAAAKVLASARFAVLLEPDGPAALRSTAASGVSDLPIFVPLRQRAAGAVRAYRSGRRVRVADPERSAAVSRRLARSTRAGLVVFEPLVERRSSRSGGRARSDVLGVLVVGFPHSVRSLEPRAADLLTGLAARAAELVRESSTADVLRLVPPPRAAEEGSPGPARAEPASRREESVCSKQVLG